MLFLSEYFKGFGKLVNIAFGGGMGCDPKIGPRPGTQPPP
jgi:hypothetical protein